RAPEVVEQHGVLVGVHAVPEARVAIGAKLAVRREALERLALEDAVLGEIVEDAALEAEEAPVDPAVDPRLLVEAPHEAILTEIGHAELELRPHDGDRREAPPLAVGIAERTEVDVRNPIGVGRRERPVADPIGGELDAAPRRGIEAGVQAVHLHALRPGRHPHPVLDLLPLVAGEEQEAREALAAVDRDHVPEDRPGADLDERLRDRLRPLAEARPAPATQDHNWFEAHQGRGGSYWASRGLRKITDPIFG